MKILVALLAAAALLATASTAKAGYVADAERAIDHTSWRYCENSRGWAHCGSDAIKIRYASGLACWWPGVPYRLSFNRCIVTIHYRVNLVAWPDGYGACHQRWVRRGWRYKTEAWRRSGASGARCAWIFKTAL